MLCSDGNQLRFSASGIKMEDGPGSAVYRPHGYSTTAVMTSVMTRAPVIMGMVTPQAKALRHRKILAQAHVFKESGIILAIFEYILFSFMTFLGIYLLIRAADERSTFAYADLAAVVFGDTWGPYILDVAIVLNNGGALLSYVLIIGSLGESIVATFVSAETIESSWMYSETFITILAIFLLVLPLCLIRSFGHLGLASYISVLAISATVCLVLIDGPIQSSSHASDTLTMWSFSGGIRTMGSIVFAFSYSASCFHAYEALYPRTVSSFR
jgi:amino acid permease